ncbi:MAG: hypothetical protein NTY77_08985 [Elusimicrobia bacterium]|nr:hypothetical protein [Elusimicrobiota bacterium]
MSGTRGPRSRTARALLVFWAFWAAVSPAAAAVALPPAATFTAMQSWLDLKGLRQDVLSRLEGQAAASWEQLDERLRVVEARLAAGSMLPAEQAGLSEEARKLREILTGARTGKADASRLAALLSASPQPGRLDQAASLLPLAAKDPGSAALVFDQQAARRENAFAAPTNTGSRSGSSANAPFKPQAKATDLRIPVPSPARDEKASAAKAPAAANSAVFISPRIAKLADASFEAGVSDLLRQSDARSRTDLSRQIAREALAALGMPDGRRTAALADFLRDIAEYRPAGAVAVHLSMDGRNHFRLIFERGDHSRRILAGQFLPGISADGKPGPESFILMGPIELSADGQAREDHPGYWRQYTGDDRRLEWGGRARTEEKGWGPWARQNQLQEVTLTESSWLDGRWQSRGTRAIKTVTTKEGKSWLGRTGDTVMETPVLGDTLKFCDQTAQTLYTGLVGAPQVIVAAASGSDTYSLEAGGSYAKNPLMNLLIDEQGHIDRLTAGAKQELYAKVRAERRRAVASQPYPISPEQASRIVDAPIDAKEAAAVLRGEYGASTYGKRLIHEGAGTPGWQGAALTAGGVAMGVVESVSESVCNPILWATVGLGHAVAAVQGGAAVAEGAAGATAGLYALKGAHAVATSLWWGPWLISATDNVGHLVETTADGKFDKEYFKRVSETGTDALYLFVIP